MSKLARRLIDGLGDLPSGVSDEEERQVEKAMCVKTEAAVGFQDSWCILSFGENQAICCSLA